MKLPKCFCRKQLESKGSSDLVAGRAPSAQGLSVHPPDEKNDEFNEHQSEVQRRELTTYECKLEEDVEILQNALFALTSHLARIQFRLRQIKNASVCERERLLCELERMISKDMDGKQVGDELPSLICDAKSMGDVRMKQRTIIRELRSRLGDLTDCDSLSFEADKGASCTNIGARHRYRQSRNDSHQSEYENYDFRHGTGCMCNVCRSVKTKAHPTCSCDLKVEGKDKEDGDVDEFGYELGSKPKVNNKCVAYKNTYYPQIWKPDKFSNQFELSVRGYKSKIKSKRKIQCKNKSTSKRSWRSSMDTGIDLHCANKCGAHKSANSLKYTSRCLNRQGHPRTCSGQKLQNKTYSSDNIADADESANSDGTIALANKGANVRKGESASYGKCSFDHDKGAHFRGTQTKRKVQAKQPYRNKIQDDEQGKSVRFGRAQSAAIETDSTADNTADYNENKVEAYGSCQRLLITSQKQKHQCIERKPTETVKETQPVVVFHNLDGVEYSSKSLSFQSCEEDALSSNKAANYGRSSGCSSREKVTKREPSNCHLKTDRVSSYRTAMKLKKFCKCRHCTGLDLKLSQNKKI